MMMNAHPSVYSLEEQTNQYALSQYQQQAQASVSGLSQPQAPQNQGAGNLNAIVEAISNSKEHILNEVSRLLDDKLSGLDEVVVELIRTKAENDSLRQKLAATTKEREALKVELASFKPFQFGLYKKESARR
ncbi:MAG: hypothetical protein H2174_07770 [Vampirovibrio sp.]|nr:hypothetical protein [Vampirovibrio sp.]